MSNLKILFFCVEGISRHEVRMMMNYVLFDLVKANLTSLVIYTFLIVQFYVSVLSQVLKMSNEAFNRTKL